MEAEWPVGMKTEHEGLRQPGLVSDETEPWVPGRAGPKQEAKAAGLPVWLD